jgi:DegV family protein with EDD domain
LVKKARGIFILDNLDYLYNGGRCSVVQHFVSSILEIRPFLNIRPDGTLGVLQKVRGSRMKALCALINFFKENFSKIDLERIVITHLGCEEEVKFLSEKIQSLDKPVGIMTAHVGCVLASHSGPKPLGIAYFEK